MGCDTVAKMYSDAYLGLGQPDDAILSRLELGNIVFRRIAFRLEQIRQSEQAISIAKTTVFELDPDSDQKDLTALEPDFIIPMWGEVLLSNILGNPVWGFIPTVHISMLPQQRVLGIPSVAFHGTNALEVLATFSFYGNELLLMNNYNQIRVWYSPTVNLPTNENQVVELPQNLVSMVTYDIYVSAIPLMATNAAKQFAKNPALKDQVEQWNKLYAQYQLERQEFQFLYEKWCKESRGSHRPRRRGNVLPRLIGTRQFIQTTRNG